MSEDTSIIFSDDRRMKNNDRLYEFIENSTASFNTVFLEEKFYVVIRKGAAEKGTSEDVRMMAGEIARTLTQNKVDRATVEAGQLTEGFSALSYESAVMAFVEGWKLGTYTFSKYKNEPTPPATQLTVNGNSVASAYESGLIRAEATSFTRDLMNELSNVLNPETYPSVLQKEFADTDVEVRVYDQEKLEEMDMQGVLTVNRGSEYNASFVEMTYCNDASKPLVALVGKGVTFDTGGISLKSGRDISSMRMDMGGSAAVAGAMKLLAESNANVNVVALIPMVENMPDSKAVLPGEIITYKNGHHVQVGNTDAEGRLILADALIRSGELNADYVVDIATLTGAIGNALGTKLAGVFGDEELSLEMKKIGDENGDFNWPMPLVDAYDSYLNSDYADFSNMSSKGEAGSITAGLFLRRFVPTSCRWLHVDMASVMMGEEKGYYTKSASGFGARLLADYTNYVSK